MKKDIATVAMVIGLGVTAYGQGTIVFDNYFNSNPSINATSGGLVFTNGLQGHIGLLGDDVGFTVWAGPDASFLVEIATFQALDGGGTWADYGKFWDPNLVTRTIAFIPASWFAAFKIQMWYDPYGLYHSYFAAAIAGDPVGEVTFINPTGGGTKSPPSFTGMPALVLYGSPEPSSFALISLGAALVFIFRRRRFATH